jgi:CHAD domain-containing protein
MEQRLTQDITSLSTEPPATSQPAAVADVPQLSSEESYKKVRHLALRQLNRFISYEAKVLKGDNPEAIHDMRVASRRLQQVLDLLYPAPRPQEVRRLRRQVRRCRQALGDVRNCDVLLDIAKRSLGRKRSARREAWTAVQQFLLTRRSESFLRATRKFGKLNFAVLYVSLKEFLIREGEHEHAAEGHQLRPGDGHPDFRKNLATALETAWSRFEHQVTQSHRHSRPEVIHGARIATKRLRYLLEVFHEFGIPGSAEAVAWLRQIQNQLGEWHDLEILEQMMIEMLARPEFLRDHLPLAMEVERLILRNRKTKLGFAENYSSMSRQTGEMHRLKQWVSYVLESPSAAPVRA